MNRIKQLREEFKISQTELGKKLNKTQQQISLYENGTNELDLDGYIILSELFGCCIEYIAGKSDIRNPQQSDPLGRAAALAVPAGRARCSRAGRAAALAVRGMPGWGRSPVQESRKD